MKTLLIASAFVALSVAPSFAAGNYNWSMVGQEGAFNFAGVSQTGIRNINASSVTQVGIANHSLTGQTGFFNTNMSTTMQFGFANSGVVIQN